jgi:hypothetical protein
MTRIGALNGITREEAAQLRRKDITTVDKLWSSIGPENLDQGIARVVEGTSISPDRLKQLLASQTVQEAKAGEGSWVKRNLIEVGLALAVVALLLMVAYRPFIKPNLLPDPLLADAVVVTAEGGLPALQVIGPEGVELEQETNNNNNKALAKVVGRYPLTAITKGETVDTEQLSVKDLPMADVEDRRLVSVPLKAHTLSPSIEPTDRVSLLFSPRAPSENTPSAATRDCLIVWAVSRGDEADLITVAVTEEDLQDIEPLLGVSEAFVVQKAPQETVPPSNVRGCKQSKVVEGSDTQNSQVSQELEDQQRKINTLSNRINDLDDKADQSTEAVESLRNEAVKLRQQLKNNAAD